MLNFRLRGRWSKPCRRHGVVSLTLSKVLFPLLRKVLVQPRILPDMTAKVDCRDEEFDPNVNPLKNLLPTECKF